MAKHPMLSEQLKKLYGRTSKRRKAVLEKKVAAAKILSKSTRQMGKAVAPKAQPETSPQSRPGVPKQPGVAQQPRSSKRPGASKQPVTGKNNELAVASEGKTEGKTVSGSRAKLFWSNLFLVHPWILVGGFWLTSIALIAIALSGLANPGQEATIPPIVNSLENKPVSAPDAAAASRLDPATNDTTIRSRRDPAATLPNSSTEPAMPVWPLLVMVAACAGGCMMMSQQGLLTPSRRGRRRSPVPAGPQALHRTATALKSKHRRNRRMAAQRPASQVMAFRTGQKIQRTAHHPKPVISQPVSFNVNSVAPTPVTVVPTSETSALDWKEGSLAHRLDVRQSRSINSFL